MSWYYACKKVKDFMGEDEYIVVEVHPQLPSLDEKEVPHTEEATFFGETPKDLAKWLRIAADEIEKHGCINEQPQSSVGDKDYWIDRMDNDD